MVTEFQVSGVKIGNIVDFRWRFMEAQVGLELSLRVGDRVHIVGPETDFRQTIEWIRVYHEKVDRGKPAQKVWIPVEAHVRPGDAVVVLPKRNEGEGETSAEDAQGDGE